jgi:HEAT repeat protein
MALLAAFIFLALASRPRRVDGKTLREWVDECSTVRLTNDFATPQFWGPKIRKFGPSAVPELVNMLEDKHPFKERVYNLIFRQRVNNRWVNDLKQKARLDAERPASAVYLLFLMGPAAEPAVPSLLRALANTNFVVRGYAINALGAIHQHPELVIPAFINLFSKQNDAQLVARALRNFGTNALPAIPGLRKYATNDSSFFQAQAMQTLAELAPESSADIIVPYCIKTIGNDSNNAYSCVLLLWSLGPSASNAVPALVKLAADKTYAGQLAPYAIKRIDPVAAASLWATFPRLGNQNPRFTPPASVARQDFLKQLGGMAPRAFSYLTNLVANRPADGNSASEGCFAAYALGEMGRTAIDAIAVLEEATVNPQSYICPAATAALMKIRDEPLEPLIEQLDDPAIMFSWMLNVKVVAEFESNAEPAIPNIIAAINRSKGNNTETFGSIALGRIQRRPDLCVPVLASILDYPSPSARSSAMDALLAFGADARPALPKIIEALDDLDPYVRNSATNLVKILDPSALANSVAK